MNKLKKFLSMLYVNGTITVCGEEFKCDELLQELFALTVMEGYYEVQSDGKFYLKVPAEFDEPQGLSVKALMKWVEGKVLLQEEVNALLKEKREKELKEISGGDNPFQLKDFFE